MLKNCSFVITILTFCLVIACRQKSEQVSFPLREKASYDTVQISLLLSKGKMLESTNPDSSCIYYAKATSLAYSIKNKPLLKKSMDKHISLLNHEAKFEDALSLSQHHMELADTLKDQIISMQVFNEAANEYEYLGDYEPATKYYLKALELANILDDKKMRRKLNNNLGSVFLGLKDYTTGYTYSEHAYEMARRDNDTVTMGNCLVNMGVAELNQKKYRQALLHLREAEKIGNYTGDMTLVADALSDEGLVYLTQRNLSAAAVSYRKQKSIADKYNLPYEKLYSLFQLAVVEKERGDFKNANNHASRAITIAEHVGTADELMEMYDTMSVIKQKWGDFASALYYKKKYEAINDSLRNQQVQTNIQHLNIQYRSAQKDKQIAEQNLSIERNSAAIERKNLWIFISLTGIVSLIIILILSLRSYRHKQSLHEQQLLTLEKQHELDTLKAKMQAREEERDRIAREMHDDIGSALTTILYLSDDLKTQDKEAAASSADKIAETSALVVDKMNEIIWSMNPDYDSLNDLVAYTRQHCAEFLRDHGLRYHIESPENIHDTALSGEQRRNIYLVIKEALHNVVKHAAATEVCMRFQINDKSLNIIIQDNGKGITTAPLSGNGLKNMRHRIENIGGSFEIVRNQGTTILLWCPLQTDQS